MKKLNYFALAGAIALLSVVGFTACSSGDETVAGEGLTPQVTGEAVKTQFSISLPSEINGMRMAGSTVQEGAASDITKFRGMSDIVLIPYMHATDRTSRLGENIQLAASSMIAPNATNTLNSIPEGKLLEKSTAVLYNDVTIPVGTSGFLFYGKATGDDGYANGALTAANLTGESANISFTPKPIMGTPVTTKGDRLAAYVTSIAQAKDATDNNNTITWAGCADEATNGAKSWYSAGLGDLYSKFITLKAGSSAYVQAAVQDLYNTLKNNTDKVSKAVVAAINNSTYATVDATAGTVTLVSDLQNYPAGDNNDMPEGAAAFVWADDAANAGMKKATAVSTSVASTQNLQDMTKIVYPASLYYFVDSDLKSSNTSQKDKYNGTNTWDQITSASNYNGTSVTTTTRSVAITKPIQYAVGRLDVKVNGFTSETYYDRKGEVVEIPSAGYTLTGVLIGGQKAVDYKFEPSGATEYTIYDKTINTEGSAKDVLKINQDAGITYTLALETPKDQDVYVALEFVNNGDDFEGIDGVVKHGCKFYMVALLSPDSNVTDQVSGVANTGNKVFKQDYTTVANFTIGVGTTTNATTDEDNDGYVDSPTGLGAAYTTIPDLRTPQLELGFSVDLTWKAGITFNYTF